MGNHHDSIALDWVRGEIQDTLIQGQHALEAYVDNREDTARLRFCLNYLHQVHGTLQMVELYGAALLTEEMEKLTQAILNESVTSIDDAIDVLMQAILQLPQYLEHLGSSRDDFPMVLLPLLNDLRAARGDSLLSDTSLFKPDLSPARLQVSPVISARLQDPKVLGHLRKLRQMYQFALAGVIREESLPAHFNYMQKVLQRLIRLCQKTPTGELWKAAGAFIETLQANANPVNTAVKALLRELDTEIRRLTDEHSTILQQPVPEALFKHLLYYVARAREIDLPQARALRETYQLDTALPSDSDVDAARSRVSGPGRAAIHSVVSALNEELARLKDQLDLFVRAELRQNSELDELLPGLRQVANTLAVLGLGIPRKVVTEQLELVERLSHQADAIDDGTLMDIAGALLYVEASLAGLDNDRYEGSTGQDDETVFLGSQELSDANEALIRESRNTLEQVKSSIVNFIASQWDTREIEHVPGLLHSIRGGLSLVPLERASAMLTSAEQYVTEVLLHGKRVPDWRELDTLADAVTSIEYYLERLADGITDNDSILRLAEDSFAQLGFPVGQEPTWQKAGADPAGDEPPVLEPEIPVVEPIAPVQKTSDHELLDDEILGIFVEEAEEVLQAIQDQYPRLRQNYEDRAALTEVRRAFHTLKGSGRMVGAISIGELAWSIENLLNRVIDQTLKLGDDMFILIDEVNARLPSLIDEFRTGHSGGDVGDLIARAEALATTRRTETASTGTETADQDQDPAPVPESQPRDSQSDAPESQPELTADEAAGPDSHDLIDDEILEIFVEEAAEVLETIREHLPMLLRQHEDRSALTEIRRAFHTLKGSGRMVGAEVIGELAWSVENMLNRIIDGSIFMTEDTASLLQDVTDIVPDLVADFENRRPASRDTSVFEARANALANGEIPGGGMPTAEPEEAIAQAATEAGHDEDEDNAVDPILLAIFENETETHLQAINDYLASAGDKASVQYTDELTRALHTLKGSANTAGIGPIAAVITPLERFIKEARAQNKRADRDALELIADARTFLTQGLAQLDEAPQGDLEGTEAYLNRLDQVYQRTLQPSESAQVDDLQPLSPSPSQLVQLFLSDGLDIVLDADRILDEWAQNPDQRQPLASLQQELALLAAGAADAGVTDVADLAGALSTVYTIVAEQQLEPDSDVFSTLGVAHEQLISVMDQVAAGLATDSNPELVNDLQALAQKAAAQSVDAEFEQQFSEDLSAIDLSLEFEEPEQPDAPFTEVPEAPGEPTETGISETDNDLDEELAAIFLEEAQDLVNSTATALQSWSEGSGEELDILRLLQRDLHTLKGGARLAGIQSIGDLAHELETLLEGLTEQRYPVSESLSGLLFLCHDRLALMIDALSGGTVPEPAPDLIEAIQGWVNDARTPAAADTSQSGTGNPEAEAPAEGTDNLSMLDSELTGIFLEEAYDLINSTGSTLHAWSEDPSNPAIAAELQRDVHTLKGGARMAGIDAIGDLTHVLEDLFEKVAEGRLAATSNMTDLLFACHDRLAQMVEQVATQKPCPGAEDLIRQVDAILRGETPPAGVATPAPADEPAPAATTAPDPADTTSDAGPSDSSELLAGDDLAGIFLDEGLEIHEAIVECLNQWREDPNELTVLTRLQQELHTLKGGARLSDMDPVADLAEAWSDGLEPLLSGDNNQPALLSLSERAAASLKAMLDHLEQGRKPVADSDLIGAFHDLAAEPADESAGVSGELDAATEIDPEVLEIFLEEAGELMDQLEQVLDDWRKEPNKHQFNQEAQRVLHTLKGGARLSQLIAAGDTAHAMETRLIDLGGNAPGESQWQDITRDHDALLAMIAEVRQRFADGRPVVEAVPASPEPQTAEVPAVPETAEPAAAPAAKPAVARPRAKPPLAQETIRVSAPLLDELVNLAAETSITRGRLEQQTSDFGHTLEEMAATIERLREQLRRMDIETEAQILFRAEQEHGPDYGDDFDPLEMDRYSSIQQLSRALSESSSDLADLRETLADRIRDAETLLVQQSRINTELQEGLMKTRMIPFSSMVPRLRRIVRQIGGELGKKVSFDVRNAEGEMDRNILERMIAPLEHMLRNALDHGIESPEERLRAGKPETGEVVLSLTREGGDVVLRMIDDGKGIPADVIRNKAIERGLLRADEEFTEREILQFILQPGFSTAQNVTQISGRGVGMDVVSSEIKQLGGSLDIDSALGRGTTFTVRLPFTVSVNRALMVATGEDFYAIPLNTIEGIVRVSTYELEEYYKPDAPLYEYAGQQYRLQYLGSLLNSDHQPKLQGQALPLPVILVRGAEQPLALQVDHLMGSREIVVKSLGPQFSSVRGVSGATILGDGNVVVILDLPAMLRSDILAERQRLASQDKAREAARYQDQTTTVMVVDDSVTVRKVTSRLLERHGMEVILAKDGLDAVAQLQDHHPDIILLDIEMPRMDGFEVASFVRHDDTLKNTPICMITSRTGEKHRERALAIGVNEYLGKPFQEAELLETIKRLTGNL